VKWIIWTAWTNSPEGRWVLKMKMLLAVFLVCLCGCAERRTVVPVTATGVLRREYPELGSPVPSTHVPYEHERLKFIYLAGFETGWKLVVKHGISAFGVLISSPSEFQGSETEQRIWREGFDASHREALKRQAY
jgi:hypothetical protein